MNKYERILKRVFDYTEDNFKGSEITFSLCMYLVYQESDTENCLKNTLKLLWNNWEWDDFEEEQYYRKYLKDSFDVKV